MIGDSCRGGPIRFGCLNGNNRLKCERKLIAVALSGQVEVDWQEVRRLAFLPEYAIVSELEKLVERVACELGKNSPYNSQGPAN